MENGYFMRRLLSSLIDKALVLVFFLIVVLCFTPFHEISRLGSYYALLGESPSTYHLQDEIEAMNHLYDRSIYNDMDTWMQSAEFIKNNPRLVAPYKGHTLSWDLRITGLFLLANFIYYLLWEWILRASLGKFLCGLIVVSENNKKTTEKEILKRCFLLLLLMVIAVGLRFSFDLSYYVTILLFFLAVDATTITRGESLIDIITNTHVVRRKPIENKTQNMRVYIPFNEASQLENYQKFLKYRLVIYAGLFISSVLNGYYIMTTIFAILFIIGAIGFHKKNK